MIRARGVLLDIDGVLSVGGELIPGAEDALEHLSTHDIPFRCISNTTRKCRVTIAEGLASMGLAIPVENIFTPAVAAAEFLGRRGISRCQIICTGDVFRDFEGAGIKNSGSGVEAVVVGDAGDRFTYALMNRAFRSLLDGADLIALEKDRYWRDADGLSLSAGPFVRGLEYAAGVEALLVGKPSKTFFFRALESLGTSPEDTLMVGDDIRTDIGGAQEAGIAGALVKTGKYREEVVREAGIVPDFTIDSIASLPEILE